MISPPVFSVRCDGAGAACDDRCTACVVRVMSSWDALALAEYAELLFQAGWRFEWPRQRALCPVCARKEANVQRPMGDGEGRTV